jgi:hypothetical protein
MTILFLQVAKNHLLYLDVLSCCASGFHFTSHLCSNSPPVFLSVYELSSTILKRKVGFLYMFLFSIDLFFLNTFCSYGISSASNRNENQGISLWVRADGACKWQLCHPICPECQSKDGSPKFVPPTESSWLVTGQFYLYTILIYPNIFVYRFPPFIIYNAIISAYPVSLIKLINYTTNPKLHF